MQVLAVGLSMLHRRSLRVVLAALLVLSATAGVIAAVQAYEGGRPAIVLNEVESGALPHFAAADAAAMAWDADARLLMVSATEGKPLEARVDPPFLYDTGSDPLVGNGRAVAWSFVYMAPAHEGEMFHVTLGGDGAVIYQRALASPMFACCVVEAHATSSDGAVTSSVSYPAPLAKPTLDADEAFSRVANLPEFVDFAADHPVFQASLLLSSGPGDHPTWTIGYRTALYYSAYALVDAVNGTVLEVYEWPTLRPPCCEPGPTPVPPTPTPCCPAEDYHATYTTTLGPSRPVHTISFPLDSPSFAREARVSVELDGGLPITGDAVLQVYDDAMRPLARVAGPGALDVILTSFPTQGIYRVELSLPMALTDIAAQITIDVLYDAVAHEAPDHYLFQGVTYPYNNEISLPMWFHEQAQPTHVTLRWDDASPLHDLELVLLDTYGNEVSSARGSGEAALDVPSMGDCCMTVLVRNLGRGVMEVPFELDVKVAPWIWNDDHGYGHPMH